MKRCELLVSLVLIPSMALTWSCGGGGGSGESATPTLYVSIADPAASDLNPGTQDEPFTTIQAAIDAAATAYSTADVFVAAGTYPVDSGAVPPEGIMLKEGISVWGGYATDWSERDIVTHISTISDAAVASAADGFNDAVTAQSGVTNATVLDGFVIGGAPGINAAGVLLAGASPTLSNNTITAGAGSDTSTGVYLQSSAAQLLYNTIAAGTSDDEAAGVVVEGTSSAYIFGNTVTGSTNAVSSYGILNDSDNTTMRSNVVTGSLGSGWAYAIYNWGVSGTEVRYNTLDGGAGTTISVGLYNYATASYEISGNDIDGGDANNSHGIFNWQTGTLTISGNRIYGGTTAMTNGITEKNGSANLIRNNLINGGGSGLGSFAVNVEDSSPSIDNNTIFTGEGNNWVFGIYINKVNAVHTVEPWITNNIIFAGPGPNFSACISEQADSTDPTSIGNNDLYGCQVVYMDHDGGCTGNDDGDNDDTTCTLTEMQALADISAFGNVSANPVFEDQDGLDDDMNTMMDNRWNLTASSPSAVTDGAADLTSDFLYDYEGNTRTAPWSMGAIEYD